MSNAKHIINALKNSPQKGQKMFVIGKENLKEEILEWVLKKNRKIAIDILQIQKATQLGFRYPKVKRTISSYEIKHALNRHANKNESIPLTLAHISKWIKYADEADIYFVTKDNLGQEVLVSGKQINGYCVVVESVRKKANELAFKTMYFSKGNLSKNKSFQTAKGKAPLSH